MKNRRIIIVAFFALFLSLVVSVVQQKDHIFKIKKTAKINNISDNTELKKVTPNNIKLALSDSEAGRWWNRYFKDPVLTEVEKNEMKAKGNNIYTCHEYSELKKENDFLQSHTCLCDDYATLAPSRELDFSANRNWDLDQPHTKNENWMQLHSTLLENIKMRDLILPGTHDSGTYAIHEDDYPGPLAYQYWGALCQTLDIYTQLSWGIRYIDARYACPRQGNEGDVWVYHGVAKTRLKWVNFMSEINRFLTDHPHEVIVLKTAAELENRCRNDQKRYIVDNIESTFSNKIVTISDVNDWFNTGTVTFGNVTSHQKKVIQYLDEDLFTEWDSDENQSTGALPTSGVYMTRQSNLIDSWPGTSNRDVQYTSVKNNLIIEGTDNTKMHVSQHQMSPETYQYVTQPSLKHYQGLLVVDKYLPYFEKYMIENYRMNINIVDFLEFTPQLPRFLLASNFNKTINIIQVLLSYPKSDGTLENKYFPGNNEALFPITNVGNLYSGSVKENSLYLPNFWKDTKQTYQPNSVVLVVYNFTDEPDFRVSAYDPDTQEIYAGYYANTTSSTNTTNLLYVFVDAYNANSEYSQLQNSNGQVTGNDLVLFIPQFRTQIVRVVCKTTDVQDESPSYYITALGDNASTINCP